MELHGGSISVTSEGIGKGSCFSIEIPVVSYVAPSADVIRVSHIEEEMSNRNLNASKLGRGRLLLSRFLLQFDPYFSRQNSININRRVSVSKKTKITPCNNNGNGEKSLSIHFTLANQVYCPSDDDDSDDIRTRMQRSVNENIDEFITPIKSNKFRRVLIVDDVAMNRKMLKRLLVTRFEECDEAEDGQQAVDMVKESLASGVNYDVITMDYQMPVMDGVTATKLIRKLEYNGQIIAVTGNALSEDVNAFLSNGANIVLTKPLSITEFDEYMNSGI